ncbi:YfhO family protein [Cryomorphaceae bacterium]|nr:YfhO family protein [Cryomorphaceae bacterium]
MAKKKVTKKTTKKEALSFSFLPEQLPYNSWLWILGVPALLGFLVFSPFLFGGDLYIFKDIGSDTLNLKYPNLLHLDRYLSEEGFPMAWSFYIGMGQNMYSGWHFGIEEIYHWFFGLLSGSVAERIAWLAWAKAVTISVFTFQWLRLRLTNEWIALFGGLAMAFSGYAIVGGSWYVHDAFVLNAVFVLWGLDLVWTRKMYFVLPLALYNFGVDPKLFFFFQFALLYFIVRGVELKWKPMNWAVQGASAAGLAIIGFLGNATGLLTRVTTVTNSPRMSTAATLSDDLSARPLLAVHDGGHLLTTWMRTLSNDLLGAGSDFNGWNNYLEAPLFYCGILMIFLIPQLILLGNKNEKRLWGAVLIIALLPLLFPYFRYAIYLFQGDYYKKALSLFLPLIFVLMSTKALDVIQREKSVHLIGLLSTAVVLLISLHYPYYDGRLELVSAIQGLDTMVILMLTGIFAGVHFKKLGALVPYALLLVMLIDLGFNAGYGFRQRDTMTKRELRQRVGYNDFTVEALDYIHAQDDQFFRITKDYASANSIHRSLNEGRVLGFYGTTQYSSFNQANYIRFLTKMALADSTAEVETRWAVGVERNPLLYPFAGVDYLLRQSDVVNPVLANTYSPIGTVENITIYQNQHRLPFGTFYGEALSEKTFLALGEGQREIQLYQRMVLSEEDMTSAEVPIERIPVKNMTVAQFQDVLRQRRDAGTFKLSSFGQNQIEGSLNAPTNGWLFFTIPFDEGWEATVNGTQVSPVRGQLGFTAVPVSAGENQEVVLNFVPKGSVMGGYASLAALLLWLGLVFVDFRKTRASVEAAQPEEEEA